MSQVGHPRALDGFSIFGLIVVLLAMIPVLVPIKIKLGTSSTRILKKIAIFCRLIQPGSSSDLSFHEPPSKQQRPDPNWHVVLNLTTSPPLAVLILLMTTTIDGSVIRAGIVGEGDSKPYDVLILFISLAYIATALDSTGALRSLAFLVSNHTSGSGPKLYFVLYCFFFVFGVIFGNDPIILSGTAFLTYFLKHCGITNPTAWIFMEFVASNVASAVLVSSNPTNVLLAQAFDLNFITGFTKFTIIPSLASAVVGFILLYSIFKGLTVPESHVSTSPPPEGTSKTEPDQGSKQIKLDPIAFYLHRIHKIPRSLFAWIPRANYIPDTLNQPIVNPRSVLIDPPGAIFHGTLMVTTLILLVGTTFIKTASVWHVTMPAGVLAFIRDILWDLRSHNRKRLQVEEQELGKEENELGKDLVQSQAAGDPSHASKADQDSQETRTSSKPADMSQPIMLPQPPPQLHLASDSIPAIGPVVPIKEGEILPCSPSKASENQKWNVARFIETVTRRFPCTTQTVKHLPLPLLPFAMSMFILISSLGHLGWVTIFARWLASLCTTPARTVYIVGLIGSLVLCPFLGTNIGATILMVNVISDPNFRLNSRMVEEPRLMRSAIFATAMASNLGAFSLTIPSSLAGLLWFQILKQKNIVIRNRQFLGWNLLPVLVLSLVSLSIVLLEIMFIF